VHVSAGDVLGFTSLFGAGLLAARSWWSVTACGRHSPVNSAAFDWDASAPPADWRARIDRWERLNSVRAWLAIAAFALLLAGIALHATRA
jgi:hypothetical protein